MRDKLKEIPVSVPDNIHECNGCGDLFTALNHNELFCPTCSSVPIKIRRVKTLPKQGNERNHEAKLRDRSKKQRKFAHVTQV